MIRNVFLVLRRELVAFFASWTGYAIAAAVLVVDGLLFNGLALGSGKQLSAEVVRQFFYFSSGTTMITGILLSMRLVAEERGSGTIVLLRTSPLSSTEIVLGKFLSALAFLAFITLSTLYMPLLVMVHGKISPGHLAAGYGGLLLLGAASIAIGLFASTLARVQVVSAIVGGAILVGILVLWFVARKAEPPVSSILVALALYSTHFEPFMKGVVHLKDVVYYLSLTYFFLLLSARSLDAQRWD
ncbi:MAG: ABC transporter permease subunit [bacterium]